MSEYQYYEFLSIDRALSPRQVDELRRVSSRAEITPSRFTNHYDFGDFKGDPSRWMERHFDAFLYFANWGTRHVSIRVPRRFLDLRTARKYCCARSASARAHGPWVILEFEAQVEDPDGLEEPNGKLGAIAPARAELVEGDLRLLYLGWMLSVAAGEAEEDSGPACPPGMRTLTGALAAFAEFMGIPAEALARAAQRSATPANERAAFRRWVKSLAPGEKLRWLEKLVFPRGPYGRAELLAQLRRERANSSGPVTNPAQRRRTARTARATASRPRR